MQDALETESIRNAYAEFWDNETDLYREARKAVRFSHKFYNARVARDAEDAIQVGVLYILEGKKASSGVNWFHQLRSRAHDMFTVIEEAESKPSATLDPSFIAEVKDEAFFILRQCRADDAVCLMLEIGYGIHREQIANILGIPKRRVRRRIERALTHISNALEERTMKVI